MALQRHNGENKNDKKYTPKEVTEVFQGRIRLASYEALGNRTKHTASGAEHLWYRICRNRGAYEGECDYTWDICKRKKDKPLKRLTGPLKEFLRHQMKYYMKEDDGYYDDLLLLVESIVDIDMKLVEDYCARIAPRYKKHKVNLLEMAGNDVEESPKPQPKPTKSVKLDANHSSIMIDVRDVDTIVIVCE